MQERKSGLELIDVTNKLNEATAKAIQLEASAEAVQKQLTEAEAARKEARDALDENSSKLIQLSKELADEKALRALQQATPARRGLRFLSVAPITMAAVAVGAVSMWGTQSVLTEDRTPGDRQHALVSCETLTGSSSQTPLSSADWEARLRACKNALASWLKQVGQSTRPIIASFGTPHAQGEGKTWISAWRADIGDTLRSELAKSGLALVGDLEKLERTEKENKSLKQRLTQETSKLEAIEKETATLRQRIASVAADQSAAQEAAAKYRSRSKADIADNCDRLAGDPFDPQQAAAKRPTRPAKDLERDPEPAVKACEEAAKNATDIRFKYQLGRAQLAAKEKRALDSLEEARRAGYPASSTLLGWIYREGALGEKNLQKAQKYYEQAVGLNDPAAMVQLAYVYRMEEFGIEDDAQALPLYKKGAELQFPSAIMSLGEFYRDGTVVPKDCRQAIKLFTDAAKLGNAKAIENLSGIATRKGCG
jgi:TPR repeat protein